MLVDLIVNIITTILAALIYAIGYLPWPETPTFFTDALTAISDHTRYFLSLAGNDTATALTYSVTILAALQFMIFPILKTKHWFQALANGFLKLIKR